MKSALLLSFLLAAFASANEPVIIAWW